MDEQKERVDFEEWHRREFPAVEVRIQNLIGTYTKTQVEDAWQIWLDAAIEEDD